MEPVRLVIYMQTLCYQHAFFAKYRYQISIACFVAMETLDPLLCGIAVKRAVQKLSECLGDELSKQEDQLLKVVLKLLQLMYSKVGCFSM